ncbi:MAG TPA: pantetheine-phosphate adenylyltransferase [Oligoflexia bacterium]|nr:pantetheine-phosphate adenylyltransferase [Oligoflexia bacterium]
MAGKTNERIAVYAGSFDPITIGHVDIIERALKVFDRLYVGVAQSTEKEVMFPLAERVAMVEEAVKALPADDRERIVVEGFGGLLVDYVHARKALGIVRGLRAVSDYEYEAQMALINRNLDPEVETVFFVTSPHCSFVSSSVVKIIAKNGGDVSHLVPPSVAKRFS